MPIPATHVPLGFPGVGPDGVSEAEFFVTENDIAKLRRNGPTHKYEDAQLLEPALSSPDCTFEDLSREEFGAGSGFCYCIKPVCRFGRNGETLPAPSGQVFLVFMHTHTNYNVVFDWEWRQEDSQDPNHPDGWREDFGRRVWRKT
jgi:hypothetical protein